MGNKYNNVFAKSNNSYYQDATNSTQRNFYPKETKPDNSFIRSLKAIFHFIGKLLLLVLRIALIVVILGVVALILIALMYPESHQQFREISQLAWERIIHFITNILN